MWQIIRVLFSSVFSLAYLWVILYHTDSGLGHVTSFDQQNNNLHDASTKVKNVYTVHSPSFENSSTATM